TLILTRLLAPQIRPGPGRRFLAVGHAGPYLTGLSPRRFERLVMLSNAPASECASVRWPASGPFNVTAIGEPADMPLSGALFDLALAVHAAVSTPQLRALLTELDRVLAPGGRLILVLGNRSAPTRRFAKTPFEAEAGVSRGELTALIGAHGFVPVRWQSALAAPIGLGWLDRLLGAAPATLGRVHVVTAEKRVPGARAIPVRQRAAQPVPAAPAAAAARARP
ncbi:MAG: methyltransferase domain-containing protein, partial [Pseudomonadota bacterium]